MKLFGERIVGVSLFIFLLSLNVFATINFSSDNSRFILKNGNAQINLNPAIVLGWRNSSIVNKVSGVGLGDYNLKQYDYNFDNLVTYSNVNNSMGSVDWNIPANEIVHIRENIYMDGYGGTINLGENSQLYIDDGVTLTLRNVIFKSSKNGAGNPAIKLATDRSCLALDNVNLNLANDFYFDRGRLFAYNDVNFSGTTSFIYRSIAPSYIKSGASLNFKPGSAFDFRPSTTGTSTLQAKDLLFMDDASSKIYLNGATLKSTHTGLRLARGSMIIDNKTTLTSAAYLGINAFGSNVVTSPAYPTFIGSIAFSPDGKYVATAGWPPTNIYIYQFTGTSFVKLSSEGIFGQANSIESLAWSPDGQYLAAGGDYSPATAVVKVFKFANGAFTNGGSPVATSANYGTSGSMVREVSWHPGGNYLLAVGSGSGANTVKIYQFTGNGFTNSGNPTSTSANYGGGIFGAKWSPDGNYIVAGGLTTRTANVYKVVNGVLANSGSPIAISQGYGADILAVAWSPNGGYIAVGGNTPCPVKVYHFTNDVLTNGGYPVATSANYSGGYINVLTWSADGNYIAATGSPIGTVNVYQFLGTSFANGSNPIASAAYGNEGVGLAWSADLNYIMAAGPFANVVKAYSLNFRPFSNAQSVSNGIILGNSSAGSSSDLNLRLLSGASASVDGILNLDNVQSFTLFDNDNSRFVLKDSNSKIRMNPGTVLGWRDRSLIKNELGVGQSDYNLQTYAAADKMVTFAEAPGELVYNNSNAINYWSPINRGTSNAVNYWSPINKGTSNAINYYRPIIRGTSNAVSYWSPINRGTSNAVSYWSPINRGTSNATSWLSMRVRTDSNAFAKGIRNNSNAIIKLDRSVRSDSNAIVYWSPINRTTSEAVNYQATWNIRQDATIRTNSNAFAYGIKNNSNAILSAYNVFPIYETTQYYSSDTTINAFAWYKDGFVVYNGCTLTLSTPIALSGFIYIGAFLVLGSDLFLSSGVRFYNDYGSGLGQIFGDGKAIHLNGDFEIPNDNVMRVSGNLVLDGNGNTISLGQNAELLVDDGVILTLRNLTLKSTQNSGVNPAIKLAGSGSMLILDNVKLEMADDLYVDNGQIYVYNDVTFNGINGLIYRSSQPINVASGATLKFNPGTTFSYRPSTADNNYLVMNDASSRLWLDGSTLNVTTTGIRLTVGQLLLSNNVSFINTVLSGINPDTTTGGIKDIFYWYQSLTSVSSVAWSPNGNYVVVADKSLGIIKTYEVGGGDGGLVEVGSGSQSFTDGHVNCVAWSPDGTYVVAAGDSNDGAQVGIVKVYQFAGSGTTGGLDEVPLGFQYFISSGSSFNSASWDPTGNYIVACGYYSAEGLAGFVKTYSFAALSGELLEVGSGIQPFEQTADCVRWSPDGSYIVASGKNYDTNGIIKTYTFSGGGTTGGLDEAGSSYMFFDYGTVCFAWSPDSIHIAAGSAYGDLKAYLVTGTGFTGGLEDVGWGATYGMNQVNSVAWTLNGQYVITADSNNALISHKFIGAGEQGGFESVGSGVQSFGTSYLTGVAVRPDGNYIAASNDDGTFKLFQIDWVVTASSMSNSIVFGNSSAGSSYDLNVKLLSGANVEVDGMLNYDNVNSTSIFSSDNSRFVLKNSNSMIRINPETLIGWRDRSLIKSETGVGQGDYNLRSYSGADNVVTFTEAPGELVYNNSNVVKFLADHFVTVNDAKFYIVNGISGSTTLNGRSILASPINLNGGTLTLNGDMILSSQTTLLSSGNFALNGYAMILGGDLSVPNNVEIKVLSSGIIDGQCNNLDISMLGKLSLDNNVTLTLRNINLLGHGSSPIEMRTNSATLALENVETSFDRDFTFSQGQLFIHKDVVVTGSNKFSYASTSTSYIATHSTLCFDKNTTFSYSPRLMGRHTLSERDLIKLVDKTSEVYFDGCTLDLPDSGWKLTKGTIYFDNRVTVNGQAIQAQSFEWGDGNVDGDVSVELLSGANLDTNAYIYHNASH